jgi:hypothetical protein
MKDLWQFFKEDISDENFTMREKVMYGVLLPIGFIVVAILGGLIE